MAVRMFDDYEIAISWQQGCLSETSPVFFIGAHDWYPVSH